MPIMGSSTLTYYIDTLYRQKFLRKPGEGPNDSEVELGGLDLVNITRSGSTYAKTTFKGHGDPGYLLSCSTFVSVFT